MKKLFCSNLAVTKSQPYVLLMVEQNKAVLYHGGKETYLHMGPRATSQLQSWCRDGVSSSMANVTASFVFLLPLYPAHLTQPEEHQLSPTVYRDATGRAASASSTEMALGSAYGDSEIHELCQEKGNGGRRAGNV